MMSKVLFGLLIFPERGKEYDLQESAVTSLVGSVPLWRE